uniref:DnaJ homolog subfamily C member 1 n=1 Tax=Nothobranchius kuhntae TaxID=321403 RepID=A0A1A8J676_NOTKU
MRGRAGPCEALLVWITLLVSAAPPLAAWDADLELLDLVEEIPQTFYQFLNIDQDASAAEVKKAYRRLSLLLHPDKNKDENAETQFRQLVSIYEVLKDEDRRHRYDDILVNGLPDWRQPVFYYRRVRKMSNAELGLLLFFILTVGHYAVIWSIYLEKQLDELLSKKKKEKKKKLSSRPAEELRCAGHERSDRSQERPHWQDILPLKLSIWLYLSIKHLPQTVQEVKQYYEDYQQMKQLQKEEAEAEEEVTISKDVFLVRLLWVLVHVLVRALGWMSWLDFTFAAEVGAVSQSDQRSKDHLNPAVVFAGEKRPKVKKPKMEFPIYKPSPEAPDSQRYEQTTSIEEIEDQMDNWLQDRRAAKKKVADWTEEELSLLSRLMVKIPGGTPGRWEKIAHELGRSVSDVTTKVKQVKDSVSPTSGLVKLSDLKDPHRSVDDSLMAQDVGGACVQEEQNDEEVDVAPLVRRRNKKPSPAEDGEVKVRGRRQRDFNPNAVEEEEAEPQENKERGNAVVWTQNQQKLLEMALQQFPRGTSERWDRIAKVVPGKTKEECMIRYKMLAELIQKKKSVRS